METEVSTQSYTFHIRKDVLDLPWLESWYTVSIGTHIAKAIGLAL